MNYDLSQQMAIEHYKGPCLVLAPAGSGKTRVLIERIKRLITKGERPSSILAITFTKKAQEEMEERLKKTLGATANLIEIKTYHGLAFKYVNGHRKFLKKQDVWKIIKDIKKGNPNVTEEIGINYLNNILHKVVIGIDLTELESKHYKDYRVALNKLNLITFDLLLIEFYEKLRDDNSFKEEIQFKYKFVLIDECQDNNITQHRISKIIAWPQNNIFWVGDDDQCIYTFAGSSVENIFSIKKDYPDLKEIILQYNYRCSPQIVETATNVISKNRIRKAKVIKSPNTNKNTERSIIFIQYKSKKEEAESIIEEIIGGDLLGEKIGVLYRKKSYITELIILLDKRKIRYYMKDKVEVLKDKKTEILHSYLMCLSNKAEYYHYRIMLSHGMKYIKKEQIKSIYLAKDKVKEMEKIIKQATQGYTICKWKVFMENYIDIIKEIEKEENIFDKLQLIMSTFEIEGELNRSNEEIELFNIYIRFSLEFNSIDEFNNKISGISGNTSDTNCKVLLYTIHSSKGKEFDKVYLVGVNEGILPLVRSNEELSKQDEEEERRICYVGITRAQKQLSISCVQEEGLPSRFINECKSI